MNKSKNLSYDLIIVGAGPAGASAAINARGRIGRILVLEKEVIGGKIAYKESVTNHLGFENVSGRELSVRIGNQLTCEEITYKKCEVTLISKRGESFEVTTTSEVFLGRAVVNATGSRERHLKVEGEEKRGVAYWIPSNLQTLRNKNVVVVGGGYVACENAVRLSTVARYVYLVNQKDSLNCDNGTAETISKKQNIEVLSNSSVSKIEGSEQVTSLLIKSANYPARRVMTESVIICIGWVPNSALLTNLSVLDHAGYVRVNPDRSTTTKGLFSIGDNLKKRSSNIASAIADGAIVAQSVVDYLAEVAKK